MTEGEPELTHDEVFTMLRNQYREKVQSLTSTMAMQFQMWGRSEIEFMIYTMGMASQDLG